MNNTHLSRFIFILFLSTLAATNQAANSPERELSVEERVRLSKYRYTCTIVAYTKTDIAVARKQTNGQTDENILLLVNPAGLTELSWQIKTDGFPTAKIDRLEVRTELRKQGIGTALFITSLQFLVHYLEHPLISWSAAPLDPSNSLYDLVQFYTRRGGELIKYRPEDGPHLCAFMKLSNTKLQQLQTTNPFAEQPTFPSDSRTIQLPQTDKLVFKLCNA